MKENVVKNKKNNLGKGMAALLGTGAAPIGAKEFARKLDVDHEKIIERKKTDTVTSLPLEKLVARKDQPRKIFNEDLLNELADSIKENGVLQPILVTPLENGKYSIIAGERRYRASKIAKLNEIPVLVKKTTKMDTLAIAIIENVQRSELNCVEEALAYYQLMTEFDMTQEELSKKIGKERSSIANYLRILKLPKEVLQLMQKNLITLGHAKLLLSLKSDELIKRFGNIIKDDQISVRELESLIKKANKEKKERKILSPSNSDEYKSLIEKIEKSTGFHMSCKSRKSGSGQIIIKFNNKKEFNDIYNFFSKV